MQNREVELKFAIQSKAIPALEAHPLLREATETDERSLVSTYFDTPRCDLKKARMSCRIREDGDRRVQTVKAPSGDMTARHEWECPARGDAPDLALLPAMRLPRPLRAAAEQLAPVFRIDVERRIWILAHGDSLIEAALDRGWIAAGDRTAPICEFELELKKGETQDLFALARKLCADLPLDLDLRAKSERGWMLKNGGEGLASKSPQPALDPAMPFAEGFRALAQACLEPLATNAPILCETKAPEALHQTRTAVRRLRALLRIFGRHVHDDGFEEIRGELKWLSRRLGAARDLDVAGARFAQHAKTADLSDALQDRREKAYARALAALDSPRYRFLLLDFMAWLSCGEWTSRKPRKITRGTIADVFTLEFHRWDRRLRKGAAVLGDLDPDERHRMRIRAKSFAYACELAASLTPRAARKDQAAYMKALRQFQSTLGDLNDARTAETLIEDMGAHAGKDAIRRAAKRNKRRAEKLEGKAQDACAAFLAAPRPLSHG